MKKIIILLTFIILNSSLYSQSSDVWTSFPNKDTTLIGFKDKNGKIRIEPKFTGFTIAGKFENIIAVSEDENGKWKSYYLTKQGKIVGRDSLYSFDNGPDCENEGFIRFKDYKTDKMGMFNGEGKIIIPAQYSNLSKVQNGMIIALKDAQKEIDGEHFFWSGGKDYLIDSNNKILIEDFKYNNELNFYSVQKSHKPVKVPSCESFLGIDGQYYSFINYDKEFKNWLKNILLTDLSKSNMEKNSFDKITYWKEPDGWVSESKSKFIEKNFNVLKLKLQQLNSANTDYFVSSDGLNKFIFESEEYKMYFNNCNEPKEWMYPVKNVIINPKNKSDSGQDHFEFLRTEEGYKLISVSLKKEELK